MSMIELNNISFGYGKTETIHSVSLKIEKGEFVALAGENGAGKSTLLRLIRGLLKQTQGDVLIEDKSIAKTKVSSLADKIGFLFQNPDRQLCRNTVRDELMFTMKNISTDEEKNNALVDEIIEKFGFNGEDDPFKMSRGERQRVALAGALVSKPSILLLDEPTTGLNYNECTEMMEYIKQLNDEGCTVLMVCHDMEIVLDYAKRVIVMDKGKIVGDGSPIDVFYNNELIDSSAVLPPQIIALSLALGTPYGKISTAEEMATALIFSGRDE